MLAQLRERLRLQPRNLQLDIKERAQGKLTKNIFQRRQPQNFRCRLLNLHSVGSRIMADHRLPVERKAHVKLKTVAALL